MTAPAETASRGLVRSMLVTGSAQAANILISIGRMKVVAILLGPAGIGILSILTSLRDLGSQAAGLGMGSSGVREIALAREDTALFGRVRRVLFAAHLVQGAIALAAVWLLRGLLAVWLLGDETHATEVGLVGVAIILTLISQAQTALLQGLRRVKDLGLVTVISALVATVAGLAAVWWMGEGGLVWFLLAQSVASVGVAALFVRRVPASAPEPMTRRQIWDVWKPMVRLGVSFMLGGLATAATLLVVRAQITQELGLDAAGQFAAAWSITMIYVGFLLNSMGADYYPRLTEVINDAKTTVRLVNDQIQLALAIAGPVLLLLIGWAPWVIPALYSSKFGPAVALVQWQTLGNLIKIAGWPMGFTNVAAGRSKMFLFFQVNFNVIFLAILWFYLEDYGIFVAGPAFVLAYLAGIVISYAVVSHYHGFRAERLSLGLFALHGVLGIGLLMATNAAPLAAGLAAPLLALATGAFGLRVVLIKIGTGGRLAKKLAGLYALARWPIRSAE